MSESTRAIFTVKNQPRLRSKNRSEALLGTSLYCRAGSDMSPTATASGKGNHLCSRLSTYKPTLSYPTNAATVHQLEKTHMRVSIFVFNGLGGTTLARACSQQANPQRAHDRTLPPGHPGHAPGPAAELRNRVEVAPAAGRVPADVHLI